MHKLTVIHKLIKKFMGAMPEIGGVVCLPLETHIQARVEYVILSNYAVKNFKDAVEIANAIQNGSDPVNKFDKKNKLANPETKLEEG